MATNDITDPTLSKLLEIEADLATQEAQLLAQVEAIDEKRKSLQSVINIFSPNATAGASGATIAAPVESNVNTAPAASESAPSSTATASDEAPSKRGPKGPRKSSSTSQSKKTTTSSKGKRGQDLQDYMRAEFGKASLPQAVSTVLQQQPDKVMGIPEIINSIYVDDTPKPMRSKASTRIANALSAGLKEKKWYRGKTGRYSLSQAAARADLAS